MKRLLPAFLVVVCCGLQVYGQDTKQRLTQHVHTLASDSLAGRMFGEPSAAEAAVYIAGQFEEIGLEPFSDSGWLQHFSFGVRDGSNVIGVLRGGDPVLKDEWLILGAHFDHLGTRSDGTVFYGADDNASGTAVLIETARALAARRGELRRSVMFVAFDGEEMGLFGSRHLAGKLPEGKVKFMASIDMVGWLREGKTLKIAGVAMLEDGEKIFRSVSGPGLKLKKFDSSIMTGSDHDPFASEGIPAVHITTGIKSPYHKPGDTADRIETAWPLLPNI